MKKAIVVGSGAGGSATARKLSERFDVTVLEAGAAFRPFRSSVEAFEPLRRAGAFFDERMISLLFPEMRVVKAKEGLVHVDGRSIGGTTPLATGNALRYDGALAELGIDLDAEFAELAELVPITKDHSQTWSDLTVRLYAAFEELGFEPQVTPKFHHRDKRCVGCGHCVLGCRYGAKWTADELICNIPNVTVVPNATVLRVAVERGRAVGVDVKTGRGTIFLPADVVVLAAGGMNTPVILNASGYATKQEFFDDPVLCVAAPWEGAKLEAQVPMPFVSQRDGYILSPYFDWLSFFFNKQWRRPASSIMSIMVKYADSSLGSFDGKHLHKPMTDHDMEIVERSIEESMEILECMGVARADMFAGTLNAGHPGGCLPLTQAEAQTLHHAHLPENLYVADATLLPRSMGNPPILTIMALATRVAEACMEKLS